LGPEYNDDYKKAKINKKGGYREEKRGKRLFGGLDLMNFINENGNQKQKENITTLICNSRKRVNDWFHYI